VVIFKLKFYKFLINPQSDATMSFLSKGSLYAVGDLLELNVVGA
jgi:hypothetical protein